MSLTLKEKVEHIERASPEAQAIMSELWGYEKIKAGLLFFGKIGKIGKFGKDGLEYADFIKEVKNVLGKDGKAIPTNQAQTFVCEKLEFTKTIRTDTKDCVVSTSNYNIYRISLGAGNPPNFLVTKPHIKIDLGDNQKPLRALTEGDKWFWDDMPSMAKCKSMLKARGKKSDDDESDPQQDLRQENVEMQFLLTLADPIPRAALAGIEDMGQDGLDALVMLYLTEGYDKDWRLLYAARGLLPCWTLGGNIDTRNIMACRPHTLWFINAGTGKSNLMRIVTRNHMFDKLTAANALGFATAKDINKGSLDNQHGAVGIEEIDKGETEVVGGLLGFMEQGDCRIGKGKQALRTRGTTVILANANPSNAAIKNNDPRECLLDLDRILETLGAAHSAEAIGRRFACILYGLDFEKAEGSPLTSDQVYAIGSVVEFILDQCTPKFEQIFRDSAVEAWFNQKLSKYEAAGRSVLKAQTLVDRVAAFLKGHTSAGYRHLKGMAFNQALMDNLHNIFTAQKIDNELVQRIINQADKHVPEICDLNMRSFEAMLAADVRENTLLLQKFENMQPLWLKALVRCMLEHSLRKKDTQPLVHPDELATTWEGIPEDARSEYGASYIYWSKVSQNIRQDDHVKLKLADFSLCFKVVKGTELVHIVDRETLFRAATAILLPNSKTGISAETDMQQKKFTGLTELTDLPSSGGIGHADSELEARLASIKEKYGQVVDNKVLRSKLFGFDVESAANRKFISSEDGGKTWRIL